MAIEYELAFRPKSERQLTIQNLDITILDHSGTIDIAIDIDFKEDRTALLIQHGAILMSLVRRVLTYECLNTASRSTLLRGIHSGTDPAAMNMRDEAILMCLGRRTIFSKSLGFSELII